MDNVIQNIFCYFILFLIKCQTQYFFVDTKIRGWKDFEK